MLKFVEQTSSLLWGRKDEKPTDGCTVKWRTVGGSCWVWLEVPTVFRMRLRKIAVSKHFPAHAHSSPSVSSIAVLGAAMSHTS